MVIYLTSAAEREPHDAPKLPLSSPYEVRFGRPNLEAAMRDHRQQASVSLAIVTCGTPQMSDVCRAAVVSILGEEGVPVEYINETMIW